MTDADRRTKAIESINGHLASIETARARVNKAKSELGTAERALRDAEDAYCTARAQLNKLLPEVERFGGVVDTTDAEVAAS